MTDDEFLGEFERASRRSANVPKGAKPVLTERGKAVVESGLTVRQAHEIRTGCSPDSHCEKCRKEAE